MEIETKRLKILLLADSERGKGLGARLLRYEIC